MYLLAFSEADDAGPGGDPTASEGPGTHADGDRSARERQPVDDREDREAADEPVVRQREADHERPPSGAETAGEEGARGPDPEPQGPVCRGEDPARIRRQRDAALEVLPDAGHAQRPSGRIDLGQGDQQPDPLRPRPQGPRPDPRGRGDGARVPPSGLESPGRTGGGAAASLRSGSGDREGRGHGDRDEVGADETPLGRAGRGIVLHPSPSPNPPYGRIRESRFAGSWKDASRPELPSPSGFGRSFFHF